MDLLSFPAAPTHELQRRMSAAYVIELVTGECPRQAMAGAIYYDIRPLLDQREHAPVTTDWNAAVLGYGLSEGILQRNSADHHLVKFVRQVKA